MNEDHIKSAVAFLRDPNVSGSPLTKKVEFLEAKGLTQEEIEESLRRISEGSTNNSVAPTYDNNSNVNSSNASLPPIDYYNVAPPVPERSWKDYFIMATATAGVSYGLYQVVTRYLIPSIIPPSQASIEKDKETIEEEFIKIDKILEQLSADQEQIKTDNEAKLKEIDVVIDNVNDFLSRYNKDKLKFDDDLRLMKLEIDNLSNSIEKNMNQTKSSVKDELTEINEELQSLKNLITARSNSGASANGGADRKIAPVSAIPSASEILKRAKAKAMESDSSASSSSSAQTAAPEPEPVTVAESKQESPKFDSSNTVGAVTVDGVTAAGIPAWQMSHREQELGASSSDTPSWQTPSAGAALEDNSEELKKKIASVGVPSWQLNAGSSAPSALENQPKESSAGIPSWQVNAQ
ncbi:Peroxisomal membrane protein PER10 (Peroxin-14) [Scheffersomyces stipitis CBS 6054]|uniref:Peroxisomal membrane protein PEX14 n=1 Tax=Scheffersomyces stipitis (strain ATCC 58785 / CBS 6054 / NBRC 10063 / NRRL Y-11545) TaxID=322104 RepID=A3M020_PICST|nr:Peroxisomal membrane protein PER10 (Peroxin-14) [Scheffersomyces stipitis CBS 6054]ABN68441.2 Peroxisomal membrane protein PER10 (Peroxin-14) [Scheffersomyces stipitis CBS 6054]